MSVLGGILAVLAVVSVIAAGVALGIAISGLPTRASRIDRILRYTAEAEARRNWECATARGSQSAPWEPGRPAVPWIDLPATTVLPTNGHQQRGDQ